MGLHKLLQITSLIGIIIIIVDVCLFSLSFLAESTDTYDPRSLDAFVLDNANEEIADPRTGILYNVNRPADFSGIQVSIVRIKTSNFWSRGLNYSLVHFPPRIIPEPNVKRMAMIYSNFGNLSSQYLNVPNHTILPPVLGFMAYVSSKRTLIHPKKMKMHLSILGDPITERCPQQFDPKGDNGYDQLICARFDENGFRGFSNMRGSYECEAPRHWICPKSNGHEITIRWWCEGRWDVEGCSVGVGNCGDGDSGTVFCGCCLVSEEGEDGGEFSKK